MKRKVLSLVLLEFVLLIVPLFFLGYSDIGTKSVQAKEKQRIVIKNNVLGDSGFGIYVGSRDDQVVIENNIIFENAEGIRLMGIKSDSLIKGNDIRSNIVGIKVQDTYSHNQKGLIHFQDMAVHLIDIKTNNIVNNDEYGILNFTDVYLDATRNYWGNSEGPLTRKDAKKPANKDINPILLVTKLSVKNNLTKTTSTFNLELDQSLSQPLPTYLPSSSGNPHYRLSLCPLKFSFGVADLGGKYPGLPDPQTLFFTELALPIWEVISEDTSQEPLENLASGKVNFSYWLKAPIKPSQNTKDKN